MKTTTTLIVRYAVLIPSLLILTASGLAGCVVMVPTPEASTTDQNVTVTLTLPEFRQVAERPTPPPPPTQVISAPAEKPHVEVVEREVLKSCNIPAYPPPTLIPTIDETTNMAENSPRDTEDLLVAHIQELREYVLDREVTIRATYDQIVDNCR